MINGQTVLAIIPARAGSKRLPGKNMRLMHGKPLILWTVEEALKSQYIDSLIVSTDDKDVVQAVKPFPLQIVDRPTHLAADESSIYDGIFHALEYFEPHDWIILLQVTSLSKFALTEMHRLVSQSPRTGRTPMERSTLHGRHG